MHIIYCHVDPKQQKALSEITYALTTEDGKSTSPKHSEMAETDQIKG